MPHRVRLLIALAATIAAAGGAVTSPALAAWTSPATLGPTATSGQESFEAAPRAAVGGRTVVATWVRQERRRSVVVVAVGTTRGRFGSGQAVGAGLRPSVAVGANGAALIVYEGRGGLRVAVRRPGAKRFGRTRVLVPEPTNGAEDSFALVRIDAAGRGLVTYQHAFRGRKGYRTYVRARRVSASTGRALGATEDLGRADLPRGTTLEAGPGGGSALLISTVRSSGTDQIGPGAEIRAPQVLTWPARTGRATRTTVPAPDGFAEGVLGGDGTGRLALAGVDATLRGDAGASGTPLAAALAGDPLALPAPFARPAVSSPNRTFGAVAAPTAGGTLALVYQQKDRPKGFSREAPVYGVTIDASGRARPPVRLSSRGASEPQVVAHRGAAIAVWDDDGRFAAARRTGRGWSRIAAPRGTVVRFHDYVTNRRLVAGADAVVLVWETARSVRLSVRRP